MKISFVPFVFLGSKALDLDDIYRNRLTKSVFDKPVTFIHQFRHDGYT